MNNINVVTVCQKAKTASNAFLAVDTDVKNRLLAEIRDIILANKEELKKINRLDLERGKESGLNAAFLDRLELTDARINAMCNGINDIIKLPDYVGMKEESYELKNGLHVDKVHVPLGVVGIIYESRPNVTVDASALCIKSGNAVVLKGGKESINSNRFLVKLMKEAFEKYDINSDVITFIDSTDREKTKEMLHCGDYIDVVIPRGGEKLKKFVLSEATMPVIASSGGNCHIYVEKTADFNMANEIIMNAKTNRPSVCNAAETILVDEEIAPEFLPDCLKKLSDKGVEIRGDIRIKDLYPDTVIVDENEFYKEYNDLIIKVKTVKNIDEAIAHINKYGTNHSEAIITKNKVMAEKFKSCVDAGCVYVNASTRFTDGFELGLGAEMGISTQKLHVRGPIGLKELTSVKYCIEGNGQIRQ